jgi:hypothetical protein
VTNVVVGDQKGTVTGIGVLRIDTPETIFGNFNQSEGGALDFMLGGAEWGQYGARRWSRGA